MIDIKYTEIIATNFKRHLSGVTSTIIQLIPIQRAQGQKILAFGVGLPNALPRMGFWDLLKCWKPPHGKAFRIWHTRRNIEMLPAIFLRDFCRMPLKIIFTSASQRNHTTYSKYLISKMDAVVATSAKTAAYLDVKSSIVPHGIDIERFFPIEDKMAAKIKLGLPPAMKIAGCFGRIRHQKGTDLFVNSMIALLPARPDWIAIVAGRAKSKHIAFERALKARVAQAGLENQILFVGEHNNINVWYQALDIFIAPQRWEGFGLTPLEAMATSVPVIATDVGAFSEIMSSANSVVGNLIPPDNLSEMQSSIAKFMDDEPLRLMAGKNGRNTVISKFSIDVEAQKLSEIYSSLFQSKAYLPSVGITG